MTRASVPDEGVREAVHVHLQQASIEPEDVRHEGTRQQEESGVALGMKMLTMVDHKLDNLLLFPAKLVQGKSLTFKNLLEGTILDQFVYNGAGF